MQHDQWFQFADIATPIKASGCDELLPVMARVFGSWSFSPMSPATTCVRQPIAIEASPKGFRMTSRWLQTPVERRDPTDLVCALVIEVIWAYLEDHPESLCLHGAASEFGGRLVVFPNQYRAGKSLLTGCLAAAGHRVFTDDILPVRSISDSCVISGIATGIAPRLRLPLPSSLTADQSNFLNINAGPQSDRYRYLALPGGLQAERNTTCPIGAFVILEREDGAVPTLAPVGHAEMLRSVVWQNFARRMPSGEILHTLHSLVSSSGCHRLRYDDPEHAVEVLQAQFAEWDRSVATCPPYTTPAMQMPDAPSRHTNGAKVYRQYPGVFAHTVEGQSFLADADGNAIHHLNETAATIWNVLADPMSLPQVVELFQSAFPDQPSDRLAQEIAQLVAVLSEKNLLQTVAPRQNRGVSL